MTLNDYISPVTSVNGVTEINDIKVDELNINSEASNHNQNNILNI